MSLIDAVASAITQMEGGSVAGSRAARNNNPGNIRDSSGSIFPALPHDSGGFVVFPSPEAGQAALTHQLELKTARGDTISQIINAWAPASDGNNTSSYLSYVLQKTGLAPGDTLAGSSTAASSADSTWTDPGATDTGATWETLNVLGPETFSGALLVGGVVLAVLVVYKLID